MANVDAAFGFRPINYDGSAYSGGTLRCVFLATTGTATFIGDAVKLDGNSSEGAASLAQCATTNPVYGVVVAFEADPNDLSLQYRKATTKRFCQVAVADKNYFEVQSDSNDTTSVVEADVGLNADFVVGTGSTVFGISDSEVKTSAVANTTTLDMQIVGLVNRVDNLLSGTGSEHKRVIIRFIVPQQRQNLGA